MLLLIFQSKKSPKDFAEEVAGEFDEFNGFNLIVGDVCSMSMVYITNRPKDESIQQVPPGIHVLSNAKLDTPWPKVRLICEWKYLMMKFCIDVQMILTSNDYLSA